MQPRFAVGLGFVWFLCSLTAAAQVTTGTISGTVKDPSGAMMPGVKIAILNEDTGIGREATTDSGQVARLIFS